MITTAAIVCASITTVCAIACGVLCIIYKKMKNKNKK